MVMIMTMTVIAAFWPDLGDGSLGGDHHTRDTGGVNQSSSDDLGWVDDSSVDHIDNLVVVGVVAEVGVSLVEESLDDD